jgi:opacity protein-like surface antigen
VKGGGAWVRSNLDVNAQNALFTDFGILAGTRHVSVSQFGFLVGGGLEYALTPNWSAKAEYNFVGLGSHSETLAALPFQPAPVISQKLDLHLAKVGMNYKF